VFENAAEGILITDETGKIVDVGGAFTAITDYSREEVLGKNANILNSGRQPSEFYAAMWSALLGEGKWQGELWNRRKDGAIYPQFANMSAVCDAYGRVRYFVAVFSDISAQKQREAQLEHLAFHDPLTQLPNRSKLIALIDQELRHAQRQHLQLALVFIDVDMFQHINDSFGHLIGDEVLQELALRLYSKLSRDDYLARIGGDEFAVLLGGVENSDAVTLVLRGLREVFERPFSLSAGAQVRLSASMGVAMYPGDGEGSDALLRNAETAMYRSKQQGRNGYSFYTESLTRQSIEHLKLQNALHEALQTHAFHLVYQPKVDLISGATMGFEALLRWVDPVLGNVSPAVFIPVAEKTGLIHEIGLWVLRNACSQGVQWLAQGKMFGRIAVNVAGQQLQRPSFVDDVRAIVEQTGLPAVHLELEVTETFMMQDPEAAIRDLGRLRDLGIALSIDDFGTGYSSLNHLKKLPIHKLKIDQSFVRDIPVDANNTAIAMAVIALGHALNLQVIAEGVETIEQAQFLRDNQCDQAQGYLYARPQLPDALEGFF
jgi:diguanylate cyclase (GGDEF)-like protein/PAS domain S-box-containing protein